LAVLIFVGAPKAQFSQPLIDKIHNKLASLEGKPMADL